MSYELFSITDIFLIFLLISLEYLLNRPKHPLESISINLHDLCSSNTLNTRLSSRISDEWDLPEIITLIELEYFLVTLLGDQLAVGDHVEFIALFSLPDYVVACIVVLLF
jgi:hypothetical protein